MTTPAPRARHDEVHLTTDGIGSRRDDTALPVTLNGDRIEIALDIDLIGEVVGITDGIGIDDPRSLLALARLCVLAAHDGLARAGNSQAARDLNVAHTYIEAARGAARF